MAYNESQQPRFAQAVARLHDVKGNPAPQITPEINHEIGLDQVSFSYELEALTGRRNCFCGITAPAIAAVSSGVRLAPGNNTIFVVTGVQVNKATAGFVSVQVADATSAFTGTWAGSFCFFRDTRFGLLASARPFTVANTHLTGGLPAGSSVLKRVQVAAGIWTSIPIVPGYVIAQTVQPTINAQFGVFNETLNEALDVMIDFYERAAVQSELVLPQ